VRGRVGRAGRVLAILPAILLGCAGPTRLARPADFPFHTGSDRFFDLHWRLERQGGLVRAVGLVEATRVDGIAEVILELRGVDANGRVLSRGLGRTRGGPLLRWATRSFVVEVRPRGSEARFELDVWSYTWEGTQPPRVRGLEPSAGSATARRRPPDPGWPPRH
jgi:hypothetical protein